MYIQFPLYAPECGGSRIVGGTKSNQPLGLPASPTSSGLALPSDVEFSIFPSNRNTLFSRGFVAQCSSLSAFICLHESGDSSIHSGGSFVVNNGGVSRSGAGMALDGEDR